MILNEKKTSALTWFYDYLPKSQESEASNRYILVSKLKDLSSKIQSNNEEFTNLIENLNNSELPILKRLEWASGSNPNLQETIKNFENQRLSRNNYYTIENKLSERLGSIIESWSTMEQLRSTKSSPYESILRSFESVLSRIDEEGFLNDKQCSPNVTEVEISLMNFEDFAEKTQLTNPIIQDYYRLLFEQLGIMKRTKQKEEKDSSTKIVQSPNFFNQFSLIN